jgi:hypothetical protein
MLRQAYEERLLRQLSIKEGRAFQAALPVSAGFSGSSSAVGPDVATPTQRVVVVCCYMCKYCTDGKQ